MADILPAAAKKPTAPSIGECDLYHYSGPMNREGYLRITECLRREQPTKPGAYLILATYGGDADAAFRIGRAFRHYYKHLTIIVPGYCKSAGTLLCIAADDLVICDLGELGPLDVQVMKRDEMFEQSSGLDIMQALEVIQTRTLDAFRDYLIEIRTGTGISTKVAAELASKLALGLYTPISDQIDPIRLGEMQRAVLVAHKYGHALNAYKQNLRKNALESMISDYPSHIFVIDRKEAKKLFYRVREPTAEEAAQCDALHGPQTDLYALKTERIRNAQPAQAEAAQPAAAANAA